MRTLLAVAALCGTALAADPPKLPDLQSKEWKEHKDHKGLKVWDAKVGDGAEAKEGMKVKVHYTGWFKDGKVFDTSKTDNEPIEFSLKEGPGGVIKGWVVGLAGMKVGGTRRLYLPSDYAYGKKGHPAGIAPDTDLIFEVELLETK